MSTTTSTRRYTPKEQMILDAGIAMGKEEGYKKGFREGANYLYTLINNNTIISELYGWKTVLDYCLDKTKELITKQSIGYMGTSGTDMEEHDF